MATTGGTMSGSNVPTGSGSETIKIIKHPANYSAGAWTVLLNGVANHIYTILSIAVTNVSATTYTCNLEVCDSDSSSNRAYIWKSLSIPEDQTFVWNDRFTVLGDDHIRFYGASSSTFSVYVTYIDQDWS
tara:strand:+ start:265 stop:654 length:390 start_codon:yes stop_codon:yes gene_type:complete